jgi:hypothetical protein
VNGQFLYFHALIPFSDHNDFMEIIQSLLDAGKIISSKPLIRSVKTASLLLIRTLYLFPGLRHMIILRLWAFVVLSNEIEAW